MKFAVVTGASRGLGESIASFLLLEGINVIGVSRNKNADLERIAAGNKATYDHISCNLANPLEIQETFSNIAEQVFLPDTKTVFLINNAGVVEPIDKAGNHNTKGLSNHVNVNLLAPMATTNIFVKKAKEAAVQLVTVNVTSGAANRSVHGWSAYSSTKAGLNRYTETVALEQDEEGSINITIAFNPGIMDTEMQTQIRSNTKESFKDIDTFKAYKENKMLRDTDAVAGALVKVLVDVNQIENGKNYDVKELL